MDEALASARLAVVREHMEAENRLDFDAVIDTFAHPRYELMATGDVFDGEEAVRGYFATSRGLFPDQRNENAVLHVSEDAVITEFDLLGTLAGTDRSFRTRMAAFFLFEPGTDRIVCERVYFDRGSIERQVQG